MKYRFVKFRAEVIVRVLWDKAADPNAVAEQFRQQAMQQFTNPDEMNVWDVHLPGQAQTVNLSSDL